MTTNKPRRTTRIISAVRRTLADMNYAARRIGIPPEDADRL